MEIYLLISLIFIVIILARTVLANSRNTKKVFKNNVYSYSAKLLLMTRTEAEFFVRLNRIVEERYFVFPQVHLSALLYYNGREHNRLYAFRHINGKSVDFVLCDKETLRPTYAIELDDKTHENADRKERDSEVERIFEEAELPLVRFRDKNVSDKEIIAALTRARSLLNS